MNRYVNLEMLPRYQDGANKGNINWKECRGSTVSFSYKGISGKLIIIEKNKNNITVEYNNNIHRLRVSSVMQCRLGNLFDFKTTYDDVICAIKKFIDENGFFPKVDDMNSCEYLMSHSTINSVCKGMNMTIDDLASSFGFDRSKTKTHPYEYWIEKMIDISKSLKRHIRYDELTSYGLPDARWMISNCPNDNIKNYNDLIEYIGFKPSVDMSKDMAKNIILDMQSSLDRPLMYDDFRNIDETKIGIGIVNKYWGSMNKMKEDLNLEIIQEDMVSKSKSRVEMLNDLDAFITNYGKIPSSNDFGKNGLMSSCSYAKMFGGINIAIKEIGYEPNKRVVSLYMSNNEIVEAYKEFFDESGFASTYEYCSSVKSLPSPTTVLRRFQCTWNEFINMTGYDVVNTPLGQQCEAKDGTVCLSKSECIIHNILLDVGFDDIEKEVLYKDFCDNYNGFKRCDWIVTYGSKKYIIEYFGLMQKDSYRKSHDEKLKLIQDNGLINSFIGLYPNDLKDIHKKIKKRLNLTIEKK